MRTVAKILSCFIPVKTIRKRVRNFLSNLSWNDILLKYYMLKKDVVCVAAITGMGDYIYVFSLLEEFKKKHNIKKICFIATTPHQYFLAKCYDCADIVVFCRNFNYTAWKPVYHYAGEKYFVADFFKPSVYKNFNNDIVSSIDGLKYLLDLPISTVPNIKINYNIPKQQLKKVNEIIKKWPKGKTVLISMDSQSIKYDIPDEWWISFANKLKEKGFVPLFNVKANSFYSFDTIFPTREEFKFYVEYFGYLVSVRSGLCDYAASSTNTNCYVIYPIFNENDQKIRIRFETSYGKFNNSVTEFFFNKWDLKNCGLTHVKQYFYNEHCLSDIIYDISSSSHDD